MTTERGLIRGGRPLVSQPSLTNSFWLTAFFRSCYPLSRLLLIFQQKLGAGSFLSTRALFLWTVHGQSAVLTQEHGPGDHIAL